MKKLFTLLLLLVISSFVVAQAKKFPPRDESDKVLSLKVFVDSLKTIVSKKDSKALAAMLHPQMKFDFDTGVVSDKFLAEWKPENKQSYIWSIMQHIIDMGGVFTNEAAGSLYEFVFPYVNQIELEDDSYFETLVITKKDVRVHQKADESSPVIGLLTYDVVTTNSEKSTGDWHYIETSDKKITGYVSDLYVYSPIDYRMFISREKGKWMISCLIAGD